MKNIKHIIPILALAVLMTGCATTTQTSQQQLQTALATIQAVVPIAVEYAVAKEPKAGPYLQAAADVMDVASSTNASPTALLSALAAIDPALAPPEAKLAVMAGVGIYTGFFAGQVVSNADTVAVLKAVASAIRQGLSPVASHRVRRV